MKRIIMWLLMFLITLSLPACGELSMPKELTPEEIQGINKATIDSLASVELGGEVEFGSQDKRPIKWNVVYKGNHTYLLVSQLSVGRMSYNERGGSIDVNSPLFHANEWANCSLRTWLNNDFYDSAFDDAAKAAIVTCELYNSYAERYNKSGGSDTKDNVFILSYSEVSEFLVPLKIVPLADNAGSYYWLRNPSGTNGGYAMTVHTGYGEKCEKPKGESVSGKQAVRVAIMITDSNIKTTSLHVGAVESDSGGSFSTGRRTCPTCDGTGVIRYNYGSSDLEAYLSGHDPYTYEKCYRCGGSGYVYD